MLPQRVRQLLCNKNIVTFTQNSYKVHPMDHSEVVTVIAVQNILHRKNRCVSAETGKSPLLLSHYCYSPHHTKLEIVDATTLNDRWVTHLNL